MEVLRDGAVVHAYRSCVVTGECEEKMRRAGCRHLPVIAEGRVVGMLSMRDLLTDEIREAVEENRALRAYLHQSPLDA